MLFFAILILGLSSGVFSIQIHPIIDDDGACSCQADYEVSASIAAYPVGNPTIGGDFGGTPCATTCNVTITITGQIGGVDAGANIVVGDASGDFTNDFIGITTGDGGYVQNFTSLPQIGWKGSVLSTNIIVFTFDIVNAVDVTFAVMPTPQTPQTTTQPPPSTTPVYSGPYNYNPAINLVDLTIAIDISKTNQEFDYCKQLLQGVANVFSYDPTNQNPPYARLSLFSFDPTGTTGFGFTQPWGLNISDVIATWPSIKQVTGTDSPANVFGLLKTYFAQMDGPYPYRDNVQRVFLHCTFADAAEPTSDITPIQKEIDDHNLKVIIINTNTAVNFDSTTFPTLYQLKGTGSNKLNFYRITHSFDPDVSAIVNQFIQNGNQLCSLSNSDSPTTLVVGSPATYTIPTSPTSVYCNYMNNRQEYTANDPNKYIQVRFDNFQLGYNYDFVTIYADGNPIGRFTGYNGYSYFCVNNITNKLTVAFTSAGDKVYSGYTSTITAFNTQEECQAYPSGTTTTTIPTTTPEGSPPKDGSFKVKQHPQYRLIHL